MVPVLSMQSTSTLARPSTAGNSRVSTLRRARVMADTAKAMLVRSTSPCGTMATSAATVLFTPCSMVAPMRNCAQIEKGAHRDDPHADHPQDAVDPHHQVRTQPYVALALACQPLRVRVGAHGRGAEHAAPGHHEAAREQAIAGLLGHRHRLPGEQRLVHLQAAATRGSRRRPRSDRPPQIRQDVVEHHLGERDLRSSPSRITLAAGAVSTGEPVEGDLGPHLLDDADARR